MPGGAPQKNTNAVDGQRSTRALEAAIHELSTGEESEHCGRFEYLKSYWKDLIIDGRVELKLDVMKEVTDRLQGRPKQTSELTGEGGGPIQVAEVRRTIVKPDD